MTTHNQESLLTKKMMQTITTIIPKLNQGKDGRISATLAELDAVETAILRFKSFLSTQDVEYS